MWRITGPKALWSLCWRMWLALGAAMIADPVAGHAMQLASGSYTGNGLAGRAITGVGFQPDAVIIKGTAAQPAVMRTATMTGDAAKELAVATDLRSGRIRSLDGDGFTVSTHAEVNGSGVTYFWTAFRDDGAGDFRVGSYVGTGRDNLAIGGLGFQPSYVIVMPDRNERAVQRSSAMVGDYSLMFDNTGPKPNYIQALQAAGFQVGTDARVNASGATYHYAAWKAVAGQMGVGSYTGNAVDGRSITGVGFRPDYLIVKAGVNEIGVHRSAALAGDSTLTFSAAVNPSNSIQALEADGFQVGTASTINGVGATYFWMAFGATSSGGPPTALAITSVNGGTHPTTGAVFSVVVQARDASGIRGTVTAATDVSLSLNTGSGHLGGTLTGTIPAGASQVTLNGATYTKAESGVVLTASRTSGDALAPGDSAPFTVDPGPITGYTVSLASPEPAGTPFGVTVTAQDQFANRVTTNSTTLVTLGSASGHVLFDSNLDGTFADGTKALSAGALSLSAKGTVAETTAVIARDANGKTGSASLTVTAGAASRLAFTIQPGAAPAGSPIPGPPTVAVQDGFGNTVTSSSAAITIAFGANPGGAALAGTTTKNASFGVASFGDLTISQAGSGYILTAATTGLAGATSGGFTITATTGTISGRITRASDGAALSGVAVSALQGGSVKGSASTGADGTYAIAGLAPGTYDVRASASGYQSQTRAGISTSVGRATTVNFSLTAVLGPSIRITSPSPGSIINDPTVMVRGEVTAPTGTQVGVTVNGVAAVVEGNQFAGPVPVDPSVGSLTGNVNDFTGTLASDTIAVTVLAPVEGTPVHLLPSPPGGVAPLTVGFALSSIVGVSQIALDADGDGVVDFQGATLDGQTFTYAQPGIYAPTVRATDRQGQVRTASTLVQVFDPTALDIHLQAAWNGFKDAVRAGNLSGAAGFLHTDTRDAYQAQLAQLSLSTLANVDQFMTTISLVGVGFGGAQYEMLRDRDGQTYSFAVWFQIDQDGLWRLRRF